MTEPVQKQANGVTVHSPRLLRGVQVVLVVLFALTLPAGAVAVFGADADRASTADTVALVFFGLLVAILTTPWWPIGPTGRSRFARIQSMCFIWFGITYATHLSWELIWLLFHEQIGASPDQAWAYPWWMYIDGGDARYATAGATLVTQEFLSVLNGLVGATGLVIWWRSKGRSALSVLLLMSTAVVHIYSTTLYFGSEVLDGYPNVDTSSFADFWIKFWLLNGLWLVMPWLVLYWGYRTLTRDRGLLVAS